MSVLVLTYGTTGDVVPYVALGKGLKKRGHSVVICASSRFEEFITRHGLEYAYVSDEITQLIESATGRSEMEGLNSFFGFKSHERVSKNGRSHLICSSAVYNIGLVTKKK